MPYNDNPTAKMGPYHMESAKQERKDLLRDNPVVRDMDSSRPWMSKHFQSTMGSALRAGHEGSPATEKMKMVKGPDGNMVPEFAVDGKGSNDLKKGVSMRNGMEMRDGMPKTYDSGLEKHCMGPRMSALENEGETGMSKEEMEKNQPDAPKPGDSTLDIANAAGMIPGGAGAAAAGAQKLGKIVKKIRKKPVKKS